MPIIGLAWLQPLIALWTALFAIAAAASTALLNLWHPSPGKRGQVLRRHSQSKVVGLMEHMIALCWAVAMILAVMGSILTLAPIVLVAGLLWLNHPRQNRTRIAAA